MERITTLLPMDKLQLPASAHRFVQPLAVLGALYLAAKATNIATWTWQNLLRSGSLDKLKSADGETWAFVTGTSTGIGKGFAYELASRGFEVILHGRNEKKLLGVKAELEKAFPKRKFRLLLLDADDDTFTNGEMQSRVDEIKHLNIRILINNVAGGGKFEKPIFDPLQDRKAENINGWINISARFPTQLTRLVLPILIDKPSSLVLNIGSGVSEMACPYLTVYSGCKAFNKVFSKALQAELKTDGNNHVEVIAVIVGQTATERMDRETAWDVPSARQLAASTLNKVGCGRDVVWGYWGHAVQGAITDLLPRSVFDNFGAKIARQMREDEQKGIRFQPEVMTGN